MIDHDDFINRVSSPKGGDVQTAYMGHGTVIAGEMIAAKNGIGIVGVAPNAQTIFLHRVNSYKSDGEEIIGFDIIDHINYLSQQSCRVVNMSFFIANNGIAIKPDPLLEQTMRNLNNMLFVVAAGNTSDAAPGTYPQHYENLPNMIVVTNYQQDGALFRTSSRGSFVDIAAPGTDILSTVYKVDQKNAYGFDTDGAASYAAPLVTATAALLLERHPNLSGIDMKNIITASADVSDKISSDDVQGSRILNTYSALVYAEQYQGSVRAMTVEPMQKQNQSGYIQL